MGIPRVYRKSGERAIASYPYIDIVAGLGFVTFNLTGTQTSGFTDYIMNNKTLISSGTTGLISGTNWYEFETSDFNLPRTVNGTAYLTGFVKNSSITGTAKISVRSGSVTSSTEGSSIATHAAEIEQDQATYTLIKTFSNVDDFVNKLTCEMKSAGESQSVFLKVIYNYAEGDSYESIQNFIVSQTYVAKTATNNNKDREVNNIKVYIYGASTAAFIRNQDVIGQNVSGITTTDISSNISFGTIATNSGFLVEIPLTRTLIKKDERLVLRLEKTGGAGSFVLDPTNEFTTEESLKLNTPFVLNL